MPRGVKGSGPPKAPPKPRQAAAKQAPPAVPAAVAPPPAAPDHQATEGEMTHPTDVDRMSGDHLKRFAAKTGVIQRDIDDLSEDRLRQCIKLMLAEQYED